MKRVKLTSIRKRTVVIAAVLLMVCGAVYLNWRYADDLSRTTGKLLGESTLVDAETDAPAAETAESDYFATARLTRQQARDSALALLEEAAAKEGAEQSVLDEASHSMQVMATYTMAEAQIENLVTAKGYKDCVAFMSGDSISVVVDGNGALSATDVAKITDIVINETGYGAKQIKILESGS